jgi:DNA repair protein RecO (recombination protein O)
MSRYYSDEGIVLRKHNVGEKDQVVVLLTREGGKKAFMAKGVRDPKSRKAATLDLMQYLSFQSRDSGKGLGYLNQVKLLLSAREKAEEYGVFEEGCEVLKLADQFLKEDYALPWVFDLLIQTLKALGRYDHVVSLFQVKLFTGLGFLPLFKNCVQCHEKLCLTLSVSFDQEHRGFACDGCFSFVKVDSGLVKLLSFFQESPFEECVNVDVDSSLSVKEQVEKMRLGIVG